MLTQRRDRSDRAERLRRAEGEVPAEDGLRRMDGHDEPDRAAGRIRSRRRAHEGGSAGRRQLQALRQQDLHHVRRARLHRQHRPPRACAHADAPPGVKGISLFVVPKFLVNADGSPGRAQRRALRIARAQARHSCEPDGGAGVRRQRRRGRLPRRRGESRPRVHVRHDESRALLGVGIAGRRHRRARVPARAATTRANACRAASSGTNDAPMRRSSAIPTSDGC